MASWRDVPVPKRIGRRPTTEHGYPVPWVSTSVAESGKPSFRWGGRADGPLQGLPLVTAQPGWTHKHSEAGRQGTAPILGRLNEDRQRYAMLAPRCQVCQYQLPLRGPWLFIGGPLGEVSPYSGLPGAFREPAVCTECAQYALRVCPGLVAGHRRTGDVYVYTATRWEPYVELAMPHPYGVPGDEAARKAAPMDVARQLAMAGQPFAIVYVLAKLQEFGVTGRDEWLAQQARG